MGCGKTFLGQQWSKVRGMGFIDLDSLIEKQEKQTINEIFTHKGEAYFREKEREILFQTASFQNMIIACGGGTACFMDNMEWMRAHGETIYLKASEFVLFDRLSKEKNNRPIIKDMSDEELQKFIYKTLNERERFYEMADRIIELAG